MSTLWEDLASSSLLPVEMRRPMGMLELFYALPVGFEKFVASEISLRLFKWLTVLILSLGVIGWRTRIVLPLGAFCYFLLGGVLRQYDHLWHTGLVPLYVMAVLSFTPCGDGRSVDSLRKMDKGELMPGTSTAYGWSRFACWVAIALPYLAAGLSKLFNGGIFWWTPTNMKHILYSDTLNPTGIQKLLWMKFDCDVSLRLSSAPDLLFVLLGMGAILIELSFVMVLFSRTARLILPALAIIMHINIFLLQRVLFFDLILINLVFYDFTGIRNAMAQKLALRFGSIQLLYDGFCPLCRRVVRVLSSFDLFSRLEFLDFRRLNVTDFNRNLKLDLTPSDLEEKMCVISRGQAYRGFDAYRIVALALPTLWPFAPLLFLPAISSTGVLPYGFVARSRFKSLSCRLHYPAVSLRETRTADVRQANNVSRGLYYPLLVSGLTVILLLCWLYRIEFYPFTAMQMYSQSNTSGLITYYRVLAHHESGITSRAYPEETIGALADGRYQSTIKKCFSPKKVQIQLCQKFLNVWGDAYNQHHPREKVVQFEIQKWTWDFHRHLRNEGHGNLVDRFTFEVGTGKDGDPRRYLP
jgi:predicted DCC family thiol-disulfide oxidoreductase YuxK